MQQEHKSSALQGSSSMFTEILICRDRDVPDGLAEGAGSVFQALVRAALADAAKGLDEDETKGEADAAAADSHGDFCTLEVQSDLDVPTVSPAELP